jgi:hypothetical protein
MVKRYLPRNDRRVSVEPIDAVPGGRDTSARGPETGPYPCLLWSDGDSPFHGNVLLMAPTTHPQPHVKLENFRLQVLSSV